ncbi:MAG: biotin--[acetyl-CoA-carboxylase] ligase, partial [Gemmatimonadota bacterium]
SLPSTNERARAWVREGVEPPALVLAHEQTGGRGRGGRSWVSRRGEGVWMSLVVAGGPPEVTSLLPLRTGLAVAPRLEALVSWPILLKWPNDLFTAEGKIGGILCEAVDGRIVVGLGVNLVAPPLEVDYPVAGLGPLEPGPVVGAAVEAIVEASHRSAPTLQEDELAAWRRRDLLAGEPVVTEAGVRGRARGIDERGRLRIVVSEGGTRTVIAGSVRRTQLETRQRG